ncbi:hypothetical protein [Corynebacterium cystitidis]|nr:hypothetical protein [Corynebacterium cystitidis]
MQDSKDLPRQTSAATVRKYLLISAGILSAGFVGSCALMLWLTDIGFVHFTTQFLRYVVPGLTPVVAALALYSTFMSLDQKRDTDERNRYYSQLQWAIDKVEKADDPETKAQMVGFVTAILQSRLIAEEERPFAEKVGNYVAFVENDIRREIENKLAEQDRASREVEHRGRLTSSLIKLWRRGSR